MRRLVTAAVVITAIVIAAAYILFGPEINLFCDRFIIPSKPVINISYTPTKVINDKIYDIRVHVEVKDDRTPIAYAKLLFIPVRYDYFITEYGMRPEDYPRAFPNVNDNRTFLLRPVDGRFDELREEFVVDIKNITGGGGYRIVVMARDAAGNEGISGIKIPYIRQFENFAKQDNVTVMALYLLWWGQDNNWLQYKGNTFSLMGRYLSLDKIVMNKHIDWATAHGIDAFLINWPGRGGFQDEALRIFANTDLVKSGNIKFAILYESTWRLVDDKPGWNLTKNFLILSSDIEYLYWSYFNNPSYLKVNGKSLLLFYEGKGIFGDLSLLDKLPYRDEIYLVSDHAHPEAHPNDVFKGTRWEDAAKKFDAVMDRWGFERYPESDMKRWLEWAHVNGLGFIPGASVGLSYKNAPWSFPGVEEVPRSPELFRNRILTACRYIDPKLRIIFISEFNNFFENSFLEPNTADGFDFIYVLRDALRLCDANW